MKHNRILATVIACLMVTAALFIGLQGKPVSRDSSLYITDQADVISPAAESQFVSLQKATAPRLSVAAVRSTGKLSTASYCKTLWENWRLGTSDMLLLLVIDEQDYYFGYDTGATYASLLDTNFDVLMERYLEPDFASGDYENAILTFAQGVQTVLYTTNYGYETLYPDNYYEEYSPGGSFTGILLILVVLVIIVAVVSASSIGKPRRRSVTYRTPTPPGGYRTTTGYRPASRQSSKTAYRPVPPPVSRPRTTISSRPRTTIGRSSRSGGFGGGGRSSGGFGGGGRSSGFGGGGRSGGMGGRGRR